MLNYFNTIVYKLHRKIIELINKKRNAKKTRRAEGEADGCPDNLLFFQEVKMLLWCRVYPESMFCFLFYYF